jgi:hypothetical protein
VLRLHWELALPDLASTKRGPLELWHLLSLDAPTVAALWCWTLARAAQIHLPPLAPAMLAMGAWLLYVLDRLLDAVQSEPRFLRERHLFHLRHRWAFMLAAVADLAALSVLVPARMARTTLRENAVLGGCVVVYLLVIHWGRLDRLRRLFPKELAVGAIFAAATAVPTWSRLGGGTPRRGDLLALSVLFAALCWLNCVAIDAWEAPGDGRVARNRAGSLPLLALLLAGATAAIAITPGGRDGRRMLAALAAVGLSALLIGVLGRMHRRWPPLRLRALTDAVLLTPLLFLPVLR